MASDTQAWFFVDEGGKIIVESAGQEAEDAWAFGCGLFDFETFEENPDKAKNRLIARGCRVVRCRIVPEEE